jgi:hypothetical protein
LARRPGVASKMSRPRTTTDRHFTGCLLLQLTASYLTTFGVTPPLHLTP